jgi:hypothetical protein
VMALAKAEVAVKRARIVEVNFMMKTEMER